jgi:hypothetical protein
MEETICQKCNEPLQVGDWPFCPHGPGHSNVIGDDIPGGVIIRHGLVNDDGSPRKFYSKTEIAREAKRLGLTNEVRHITDPKSGSDKNPHTKRWV